jgi:hypothetical protein
MTGGTLGLYTCFTHLEEKKRLLSDGDWAVPEGGGGWLDEDDKQSLNLSEDCLLAGK